MRALQVLRRVDAFPCASRPRTWTSLSRLSITSPALRRHQPGGHRRPRCFEIERKLKEKCDIPVFHDDQHGTAIIALASSLTNALRVVGKRKEDVKVVFSGRAPPPSPSPKLLLQAGFRILPCVTSSALCTRETPT